MSLDMSIQIDGLDDLVDSFKKSPSIVRKHGNDAIKKSILTLLANAKKAAPVDRGFLRTSGMVFSFSDLQGLLQNVAPYAIYVHEGTRPHYVPIGAIQGWADRHGIPAFAVQRSIMRKGTKPRPFFRDSIEESQSDVDKFFSKALENIIKELT